MAPRRKTDLSKEEHAPDCNSIEKFIDSEKRTNLFFSRSHPFRSTGDGWSAGRRIRMASKIKMKNKDEGN